jgi:hypothetical protein
MNQQTRARALRWPAFLWLPALTALAAPLAAQELWRLELGDHIAPEDVARAAGAPKSAFFVAGGSQILSPSTWKAGYLARVEADGEVAWAVYPGLNGKRFGSVAAWEKPDAEQVYAATLALTPKEDTRIYAYSQGALFWGDTIQGEVKDLVVDDNGALYVVGRTTELLGDVHHGGTTDAYVRKYSSEGKVLWTQQIGTKGEDVIAAVTWEKSTGLGIVGTQTFFEGVSGEWGFLSLLDTEKGVPLWQDVWDSFSDTPTDAIIRSLVPTCVSILREPLQGGRTWMAVSGHGDTRPLRLYSFDDSAGPQTAALDWERSYDLACSWKEVILWQGRMATPLQSADSTYEGVMVSVVGTANTDYPQSSIATYAVQGGLLGGGSVDPGTELSKWLFDDWHPTAAAMLDRVGNGKGGFYPVGYRYTDPTGFDPLYEGFFAYFANEIVDDPPTANAGPDRSIYAGETVTLDGSGSWDDRTPTIDMEFRWEFTARPDGSNAVLVGADTVSPSFVADLPGTYEVSLVVTDGALQESAPDTVVVSSLNVRPTANAGLDRVVVAGATATLDGQGSTDPNGDQLWYQWLLAVRPEGSVADLLYANTATPTLTPDLVGTYEAELIVWDGTDYSAPDRVVLTAIPGKDFAANAVQEVAKLLVSEEQMPETKFEAPGQRESLSNEMGTIAHFVNKGQVDQARDKLLKAISRTDGCKLRGAPDPKGNKQVFAADFVTDCAAQLELYASLTAALEALDTP